MKLSLLLKNLGKAEVYGNQNVVVKGIVDDTRNLKRGDLFVAISGLTVDSHRFIPSAIEKGAIAIVGEIDPDPSWNITYIKVPDSRKALGLIASMWYGNPSQKLKVIGVTGTDGKTTTSNLIWWILNKSQKKTGLVSTINARVGEKTFDTGFHVTTPNALELQKYLSLMVKNNCQYAVVEVTSHAIDQERIAGITFDSAVLTNITHEHLDYHKTFKRYRETKSRLFANCRVVVINKDDRSYPYIKAVSAKAKVVSYSLKDSSDFTAHNIVSTLEGTSFSIGIKNALFEMKSTLVGSYNVSNLLAATCVATEYGSTAEQIQKAVETFPQLPGRLEKIDEGQPFSVFVDFAHTPNALKNLLLLIRKLTPRSKKIILVFGCAGLRDNTKRPMMGKIAARYADTVFITAEDPRTENITDIYNQITSEIPITELSLKFQRQDDRKKAIQKALSVARDGDIVLITGKGHETSMCFGTTETPWSDKEETRTLLRSR